MATPTPTPSPTTSQQIAPDPLGLAAALSSIGSQIGSGKNKGNPNSTVITGAQSDNQFPVSIMELVPGAPRWNTINDANALFINAFRDPVNAAQLVAIQDAMLKAGFYGKDMPIYGRLSPADIAAFGKLLEYSATQVDSAITAGATFASRDPQTGAISGISNIPSNLSVLSILNGQAQVGVANGAQWAAQQRASTVLKVPADANMNTVIDAAYTQLTGRGATDADKAAFRSAFRNAYLGPQVANEEAGITAGLAAQGLGPGMPSLTPLPTAPTGIGKAPGYVDPSQATSTKGGYTSQGDGGRELDIFMQALGGQESGNPDATNPNSGAHGKYQIMPGNWPSWAAAAGLSPNAPQTAANQEIVARAKVKAYYNAYHDWGAVAAAWYGGPGMAQAYLRDPHSAQITAQQYTNGVPYPSVANYVASVMSKTANLNNGQPLPAQSVDWTAVAPSPTTAAGSPYPTVSEVPTAADYATDFVRKRNPVETGAHDISDTFNTFLSLLKSGV